MFLGAFVSGLTTTPEMERANIRALVFILTLAALLLRAILAVVTLRVTFLDKRKTYRHNHPTPGGSKFCFMVPQHATCKTNRTRDRLSMDIIQLKSRSALRSLWDSIRRCRAQHCNKLRPKTDCHLEPNFENTRAHTAQGAPWGYEQTRAV